MIPMLTDHHKATWVLQSDAAIAHHAAMVKRIRDGFPANPNERPPSSLAEQAQKQIARLECDLEEWRQIARRAATQVAG